MQTLPLADLLRPDGEFVVPMADNCAPGLAGRQKPVGYHKVPEQRRLKPNATWADEPYATAALQSVHALGVCKSCPFRWGQTILARPPRQSVATNRLAKLPEPIWHPALDEVPSRYRICGRTAWMTCSPEIWCLHFGALCLRRVLGTHVGEFGAIFFLNMGVCRQPPQGFGDMGHLHRKFHKGVSCVHPFTMVYPMCVLTLSMCLQVSDTLILPPFVSCAIPLPDMMKQPSLKPHLTSIPMRYAEIIHYPLYSIGDHGIFSVSARK